MPELNTLIFNRSCELLKLCHIHLVSILNSFIGMKVFVHGGAATPIPLLDALARRGQEAQLKNVELIHIHTEGHDTVVSPEFEGE